MGLLDPFAQVGGGGVALLVGYLAALGCSA